MWRLDPGRTPVVVAEHTPDAPQLPASVMKLVTSGGALLSLGPSFRFRTSIYTSANAVRDGRVLRGTVYLKGSGDPVLATPAYARAYLEGRGGVFNGITRELSAGGVRLVRGPIVADESLFDSRRTGLQWRSYYTLYSPPLSALNVNQNHQGDGQARYVPDPPVAAAAQLRAALRRSGIRHAGALRTGRTPATAVTAGTVVSPPLSAILTVMNHESDNFIAEVLRKDVGAYGGRAGTSQEGAAVTVRLLSELGVMGANDRVVDGSGLSRANRLTANTLVRLLAAADAQPQWGDALIDSLATGGTGTLIRRFKDPSIRSRVHGKTGYIDGVSALAGVAESPSGVRYAFAFLMNDWDITGAKATQDRIVTMLAKGAMDPPAQPGVTTR
ncbi:MAG: D-alanyl-D-alanine carboxypeptidase/D-alanyl-D-alanine-endopeptidase [Thermoleophilia bacterium]